MRYEFFRAAASVLSTVEGKIILGAAGIGASLLAAFAATRNELLLGSGLSIFIGSALSLAVAVRSLLSREETRRQHEETKSELRKTNSKLEEMNGLYEKRFDDMQKRFDELRDLLKGSSAKDDAGKGRE